MNKQKHISALIIDDEAKARSNLADILKRYCPVVVVVGFASNPAEGLSQIKQLQPQLIFLDIEMPGGNGFEMLRSIQQKNFEVIFVTAYDKYGIQALKHAAIDYLLKPVNYLDLCAAIDKAEKRIAEKQENIRLKELLRNMDRQVGEKRIGLPLSNSIVFVELSQIIRCEADNNYTLFILSDNRKLLVCKTLKEYEDILSEFGFIRTHQSHLVNRKYIEAFVKTDGGYLKMIDGAQVPISRFKKQEIMGLMKGIA